LKKSFYNLLTFAYFILLFNSRSTSEEFFVISEVEGPVNVNCYLLYQLPTREAAIFDVGGPLDSLVKVINEKELRLKYIFITHAHWDHVEGLSDLKEKFPRAKVGLNKEEYLAMQEYTNFAKESDPDRFAELMQDSAYAKMVSVDFSAIKPDIFVKDNEEYKFGNSVIKTIFTPGHSAGSMCFSCNNFLFTGDVLFYRTVGNTDFYKGSRKDLIHSVRKLYHLFPDSTIVYPGHGQFTDIGSEKLGNERITIDGGEWDKK
jgi:hydroxyacylglutathione hydrolase